ASYQGWIYCRDHQAPCVDIVVKHGRPLGKNHQTWMMNEINKPIWPPPTGIGVMDDPVWQPTPDPALKFGVVRAPPSQDADTTTHATKALSGTPADTKGASWTPATVTRDGAKP